MITELRLTNFRAFRNEQRIPLSRLNLIFGQNSSGKSSIIQGLLFLYGISQRPGGIQPHSSTIQICGQSVRIPTVYDSTHTSRRGSKRAFSVALTTEADGMTPATVEFSSSGRIAFSIDGETVARILPQPTSGTLLRGVHNRIVPGFVEILQPTRFFRATCDEVAGELHGWMGTARGKRWLGSFRGPGTVEKALADLLAGGRQWLLRLIRSAGRTYHFDVFGLFPRYIGEDSSGDVGGIAEDISIQPRNGTLDVAGAVGLLFVRRLWTRYISILTSSLNSVQLAFLHPVYLGPRRGLIGAGTLEYSNAFHGSELAGGEFPAPALFGGMILNRDRVALANKWLRSRRRTDTQVELRLSRVESTAGSGGQPFLIGYRLGIYDRRRKIETDFAGVGAGFSELTPILLACVHGSAEGDDEQDDEWSDDYESLSHLVIVEQPEIHLHPALQAEVGDLLIEGALRTEASQVIAESHSEYLLLRILRRIRETTAGTLPKGCRPIRPEDVSLLYVDNLGSRSVVHRMPINERGELVFDWPAGFFDAGIREFIH